MTAEDLARSVARDLGPEAAKSTEAALKGEGTRGWKEATDIGILIVEVCRVAWEIYKHTQARPALEKELLQKVSRPASISEAKSKEVVDRVIDYITSGAS